MENLSPVLQNFINEFEAAKEKAGTLRERYPAGKFNIKLAPGKWCAGECIVHLIKTGNGYLDNVFKSLNKSNPSEKINTSYKPRLLVSVFIKLMKPGNKLKFKAPKVLVDEYDGNIDNTIEKFYETENRFITAVHTSAGYDLNEVKVATPVTGLIKFELGEVFMAMIEHQKRHIKQAEDALNK